MIVVKIEPTPEAREADERYTTLAGEYVLCVTPEDAGKAVAKAKEKYGEENITIEFDQL